MRSLLLDNPEGIIMPQVVPLYKTKFGKEFNPEHYGRKKLLQVLEDIPDVVEVRQKKNLTKTPTCMHTCTCTYIHLSSKHSAELLVFLLTDNWRRCQEIYQVKQDHQSCTNQSHSGYAGN